jgi:hypothetical protein
MGDDEARKAGKGEIVLFNKTVLSFLAAAPLLLRFKNSS